MHVELRVRQSRCVAPRKHVTGPAGSRMIQMQYSTSREVFPTATLHEFAIWSANMLIYVRNVAPQTIYPFHLGGGHVDWTQASYDGLPKRGVELNTF